MITEQTSPDQAASVDSLAGPANLRKEMASRYKKCDEFYKDWNRVAREDMEFALGNQWTSEERTQLKNEARPCLTFNRIRPLINIVSGYQRENSSRIKVNPEGGEDKIFSEVMDKALNQIDKVSKLNHTLNYAFDDGCYVGKSFIESYRMYEKDPIHGDLKFQLRSPYEIMPDPEFKGYDINDGCEYLFKIKKYTVNKLIELFPDKERLIKGFKDDTDDLDRNVSLTMLEGDGDDMGNRPNKTTETVKTGEGSTDPDIAEDQLFTLKEYWRLKRVKRFFVIDSDSNEPVKFEKKDEAEMFAGKQGTGVKVIERTVNEMWVADFCCGVILQDIISPLLPEYNGFPFFRFMADWAPNAETEEYRVQGMTRQLKDPQREKNKAKSQSLHILNTQANSGWIGDDDALAPEDWKKLEEMGSRPGITIKKKRGADLREILPKTVNQGHILREQSADEEFKQISNINPDLLGLQDNKSTSGKAMAIRIKQAVLALSRLFSNYRYTKEIIGTYILSMVPALFDENKLERVLGPEYMKRTTDAEKYPQGINKGHLKGFLQIVKDNRYDLIVAEADSQSTLRYETFMELVELAKTGAPIPPDLFIDFMDFPNQKEVKTRVMDYANKQMAAAMAAKGAPSAQGAPA